MVNATDGQEMLIVTSAVVPITTQIVTFTGNVTPGTAFVGPSTAQTVSGVTTLFSPAAEFTVEASGTLFLDAGNRIATLDEFGTIQESIYAINDGALTVPVGRVVKIKNLSSSPFIAPDIETISSLDDIPAGVTTVTTAVAAAGWFVTRGRCVEVFNPAGSIGDIVYSDATGTPTLTETSLPIGTVTDVAAFSHEIYIDIASFQYRDTRFTPGTEKFISYDSVNGNLYEIKHISLGSLPNTASAIVTLVAANVVDWTKPVSYQGYAMAGLQVVEFPYVASGGTDFIETLVEENVGTQVTEIITTSNFNATAFTGRVDIQYYKQ